MLGIEVILMFTLVMLWWTAWTLNKVVDRATSQFKQYNKMFLDLYERLSKLEGGERE
jgi:hypothetical protein